MYCEGPEVAEGKVPIPIFGAIVAIYLKNMHSCGYTKRFI